MKENKIDLLEPKEIWNYFYRLSRIPRPSRHEERVRDFVCAFGKEQGLETMRDEAGNIIIRKPATAGMEKRRGVILQAHLDMVPQKNSGHPHDFMKDPIEVWVDGDWVKARGTTLGADNGIGVAAAMAVLASSVISHGPLEALFTATEETGMDGAKGLKPGLLKGEILLNMDSEDEGQLYVGCAGGEDVSVHFDYRPEPMPEDSLAFRLEITGMKGGHSGMDINLQRGNANKVFFRLLNAARRHCGARLASVEGGSLRNAIPREAFGLLVVEASRAEKLKQVLDREFERIRAELFATEPGMKYSLNTADMPDTMLDVEVQECLTAAIMACPNGVIRMDDRMSGLVETSSNLAVVYSDAEKAVVELSFLIRSSVDSAKTVLGERLEALFILAGAKTRFSGVYPGWKPDMDSVILGVMQRVYQDRFGKMPEVKAIHAGLECGLLGGSYPHWDMISFGPTICFPHSPDEKVHIGSVGRFWTFLLETLKEIPRK